jgi:Prolyl oligopeptidase family
LDTTAALGEPTVEPEWLVRLFPDTGEPDECAHRFRRVEAVELPVGEHVGGQVTCEFVYRAVDGATQKALARIFLPSQVRDGPHARVPLMCNAGYDIEPAAALALIARGWAVSTPYAHPENPLGRGPNLDVALLHAARALPFVDNTRVMVQGGSAGGYMALMLAAETFPLVCALPMVPPVNWGYNAAYFFYNREVATAVPPGSAEAAMRVLTIVIPLGDAARQYLGPDTDADSWLMSSPVSQLDCFTAPVQVVWSTGDILVPIDQVGAQFVRGLKPSAFPSSFTASIDALMSRPETRATLLDGLPEDAYEAFLVPVPPGAPILEYEREPSGPPVSVELPFSRERVWSIVVIDEGPLEPDAGHFRYAITPVQEPFLRWALARGITADQCTVPKLTRLMMRLIGREYRPFVTQPEGAAAPIDAVRLDFPEAERQDVLRGLLAFAEEPRRAKRLAACYGQLPRDLKALGPTLGATAREVRARLADALGEQLE